MSVTGLDLPVLMSDEHIRQREFVIVRRGYDPAQVRGFLEQVADEVRKLEAMLQQARVDAEAAARSASKARTDPYAELADRVAGVLRAVDAEAQALRLDAGREAERIVVEARADAERILSDAEARADEIRTDAQKTLREAQEQADRAITGLSAKRDTLVEQLAAMQERLIVVARDLESTIGMPEPIDLSARSASGPPGPPADAAWGEAPKGPPSGTAAPGPEAEAPQAEARAPEADVKAPGAEVKAPEAGAKAPEAGVKAPEADVKAPEGSPLVVGEAEELFTSRPRSSDEAEGDLDDDAELALVDPTAEGLWDGTDAIGVDIPDIPPLDLDWGDVDKDDDR
jgi:DivIVA domain-containing protein